MRKPRRLDDVNLVGVSMRDFHGSHTLSDFRNSFPGLLIALYDRLGRDKVKQMPREILWALTWREMGYCLDAPDIIPAGSMQQASVDVEETETFPMLTYCEREYPRHGGAEGFQSQTAEGSIPSVGSVESSQLDEAQRKAQATG